MLKISLFCRKHLAARTFVVLQLLLKFGHGVELLFVSDEAEEVDFHVLFIDIFMEIEEVDLDAAVGAVVESGTCADVEHTRALLGTDGIDAVHGDEFVGVVGTEIGRRKTEGGADVMAADHGATEGVGTSEHGCGVFHTALLKGSADGGGGNVLTAIQFACLHNLHANLMADADVVVKTFGATMPKAVVVADDEDANVEAAAQNVGHEGACRQGGKFTREGQHGHVVGEGFAEQSGLFVRRGEQLQGGIGTQHTCRMCRKGDEQRPQATSLGLILHLLDEVAVASVYAVEESDGGDAGLWLTDGCTRQNVLFSLHEHLFSCAKLRKI